MSNKLISDLSTSGSLVGTEVVELDDGSASVKSTLTALKTYINDNTALSATNLTSGTVPDARFPATLPAASGVNLTALNATNLASGTVAPARLGTGSGGSSKFLREDSTFQTISGGGDALTSGNLSQFAATTSAQLAGVLSDETGTGAAVFATGPTITINASCVSAGTMATARLGSGSASSTTFLRGDQTYAVPVGGAVATITTKIANYTAAVGDLGSIIEMNVGSANTLTVDTNANQAFAVGSTFSVSMKGAGVTTLTPAGGVTFRNISGATLAMLQYQVVSFYYEGSDVWYVTGLYYTTLPAASGVNLTALNATNLGSGTVPDARLNITTAGTVNATAIATTVNNQAASYTLVLADAGKIVEINNASANTLTVPTNASVAFPVGTRIDGYNMGAGLTTITAAGGVTIRCTATLVAKAQYAMYSLYKRATDEWVLTGDLT